MDILTQHKFIIVGSDGLNALGIVRSLGEIGIRACLIRVKESSQKSLLKASRYVDEVVFVNPSEDIFRVLIEKYGNEAYKPFLFFTDDWFLELSDAHYEELKDLFFLGHAGQKGMMIELLDKGIQCRLAKECGMKVPAFEVLKRGSLPQGLSYPLITKTLTSNLGRWKKDMIVCGTEEELCAAYAEIEAEDLIVEEFIEKKYEVTLKGFSINGGEDIYFSHQKKWHYHDINKGELMFYEPCKDEILKEKVRQLIRKTKYSGIFDVEFICTKEDELLFLEVNWRSAMYNYNHVIEGVNLPYLWAKSTLENRIPVEEIRSKNISYTALDEISSFSEALRHFSRIGNWIHCLRKADCLYYYNRKDIKPCIVGWRNFINRKLKRIVKPLH